MLTVTTKANKRLCGILQKETTNQEMTIRIKQCPSIPNTVGIVLDKEREGDRVVKTEGGIKVLVIQSDLAPDLEDMVLDFQETPQGSGFTLSKIN